MKNKEKDFVKLSEKWFDNQARVYDETDTILYSKYGKISCKNIYDYLADKEYDTLLDVGCGTAYLINLLSQTHNAKYTGLDLSSEMIKQAQNKNIPGAEFVVARSDDMPFADNSFYIVTCSQSFHLSTQLWQERSELFYDTGKFKCKIRMGILQYGCPFQIFSD